MRVELDGLEPGSDVAFAFFVVRLESAVDRDGLLNVLRAIAQLIPDVDAFIAEFPEQLEGRLQLIAIPWAVPSDDADAREQAELVDAASAVGVIAAWFFQTGDDPPQLDDVPFPLDEHPGTEPSDLGLAIKLDGDELDGENTVLLAFHTLWLAPYRGRYHNTALAIDREHRAAQLWVERLDASDGAVAHLTWIAAMLDRVMPIVHARFASRGDDTFVLAGNPVRACYREGGEPAVDAWIGEQTIWGDDEVARMLCELADDLADGNVREPDGDTREPEGAGDVTRYAGELLIARARAGRLDRRALPALMPVLAHQQLVMELAGAARDRAAVPVLVGALATPLAGSAATALGAIGDPASAPALLAVMASSAHDTAARVAAARALAFGSLAVVVPAPRRVDAARAIAELAGAPLAAAAARALSGEPAPELADLLHAELTGVAVDHEATVERLRAALEIAEVFPANVRAEDVVWISRFAEPELRAAAHAVLDRLGAPLAPAPVYDAAAAHDLDDAELVDELAEPHVVGRAALIDEAGDRQLASARRAIVGACSEVIARARPGTARLLHHDARVLEAGVAVLRGAVSEEDDTIALFDRMLRNSNIHVKWELLQQPPVDARLIGGMFHVLGERWGWQELVAKRWLARFAGTQAYEAAYDAERGRRHPDDEDAN